MKKRIFIITILSIAMLTACNESGKTNDISKAGRKIRNQYEEGF